MSFLAKVMQASETRSMVNAASANRSGWWHPPAQSGNMTHYQSPKLIGILRSLPKAFEESRTPSGL